MPTPHATTPRSGSRKRPAAAPRGVTRQGGPGIVAAGAAQAVRGHAIDAERKRQMIAEAAYYRAEKRGFTAGGDLQDWLEAEAQVEAWLGS